MAASGYFNTNSYEGRYLQFSWVEKSQNVATNTTTISWALKGAGGDSTWYNSGNFKVVIAGTTVYSSSTRIKLYNGTTVASGTVDIKHKDDGTQGFTASAEAGIYSVAVNCKGSGSFTLDTIARASQPSCITWPEHTQNVGEFGDVISIHMNRKSSAFTHKVRYAFGDLSGTCIDAETGKEATAVDTGFTWKIPESFMNLLTAATSGSGTIYVDTYNGSTKIGTKWCGFTAKVPASVKPKCSIQVLDNTEIQKLYGNLVKGLSKLYVKTTGTQAYGSPISAYTVNANGVKYTKNEIVTGVLTKAGTTTVTATVKDKRGRTSEQASASFTVLDYSAPTISKLTAVRCDANGTINKRGAYVKVMFSAAISSMSNKNTALYYLYYKKSSEDSWTKVTLDDLTNKFTVTNYTYIFDASKGSSYNVSVEAVDRHNSQNPTEKSTKAPTAFSILSWRGFKTSNGVEDGFGIGKVPEKPNVLQVGWNAEFDKDVVQTGNSYCSYSVGTSGVKGYVKAARLEVVHTNANAPITFYLSRRNADSTMTVHVRFQNVSNLTPGIDCITYEGENYGAFLYQESASVWVLYVEKTAQNDPITVQRWTTSPFMDGRVVVTFPNNEQVDTLTTPWYRATPLVPRNILDSFFPVGYILLLYSHADPNTMYPGTTWVRIYGAFPWFTDANGEIGLTGGERTVTLTAKQMPVHNHGGTYTNAGTARTHSWLASGGSAMGYDTVEAGGGEAHNNMPPYIQISAWRRTA